MYDLIEYIIYIYIYIYIYVYIYIHTHTYTGECRPADQKHAWSVSHVHFEAAKDILQLVKKKLPGFKQVKEMLGEAGICTCVCMFVCVYVCLCLCMFVCVYAWKSRKC